MRPPWLTHHEADDTETLQTDVMRFLAILGLCLTAIFSLVQSATVETAAPLALQKTLSAAPAQEQPTPIVVPRHQQNKKTDASPAVPANDTRTGESNQGFTLGFTSATAMQALLETGKARLYASSNQGYWQLQQGGFVSSPPPQSYYEMDAATVPANITLVFSAVTGTTASRWGVTLPDSTAADIERIMAQHEGGELVIDASGKVSIGHQ